MSTSNATPNYQVTAENAAGLLFKNKRDRKILNVDPKVLTAIAFVTVTDFKKLTHHFSADRNHHFSHSKNLGI